MIIKLRKSSNKYMNYKKKYLKYKSKYFNLKKQIGGQRTVTIYDKNNKKQLFTIILDGIENDITELKEKIIIEIKKTEFNIRDIKIFEYQGFCKEINEINDSMNKFCISIIKNEQFVPLIMNTGLMVSMGKREFTNTTDEKTYKSNLIVEGSEGIFTGFVNKGKYLEDRQFIDLDEGKGVYKDKEYAKDPTIILEGTFKNNKLYGKGKKIIFGKDGMIYIYTGNFINNLLVDGNINFNNVNFNETWHGNFDSKDGIENISSGTILRNGGKIEEGTFKENLLDGEGKMILGDIVEEGIYIEGVNQNSNKRIYKTYGDINNSVKRDGIIVYLDGVILNGKFNDNKFINGKKIYPNGNYDLGNFVNNKLNGQGTKYIYNDDVFWEGNFVNGIINGPGKVIFTDDNFNNVIFENGDIIQTIN